MNKTQRLCLFLSALLLIAGSYQYMFHPVPVALEKDLRDFPSEIGAWRGEQIVTDGSVLTKIGADNEISRIYRNANGKTVQLYIGYFSYQDQEKKLVSYKTAGFERNASRKTITVNPSREVDINQVLREERGHMRRVLFWYDIDGCIVVSPMLVKAYTAWNALTKRRTNGAVVMLTTDLLKDNDFYADSQHVELFMQAAWPLLQAYLPRS